MELFLFSNTKAKKAQVLQNYVNQHLYRFVAFDCVCLLRSQIQGCRTDLQHAPGWSCEDMQSTMMWFVIRSSCAAYLHCAWFWDKTRYPSCHIIDCHVIDNIIYPGDLHFCHNTKLSSLIPLPPGFVQLPQLDPENCYLPCSPRVRATIEFVPASCEPDRRYCEALQLSSHSW